MARPAGLELGAEFFARPADEVAQDLIGKILWRDGMGGGRLTEVEAYLPREDPACHAYRGLTERNWPMFGPPGHIYVYLSYGVHVLLNLVCDQVGVGAAVLVRSLEPIGDREIMRRNRTRLSSGKSEFIPDHRLTVGPGCVGQALALDLGLNGLKLGCQSGIFVLDDGVCLAVGQTTRVGISKGTHLPLRYFALGSRFVSHLPRS
ncbi:MAG: DNA-3-methyladenine glycosylase [Thermoleophilia bacterium]|nr:DNA-3-methyladenine glycosylase [Thermoleophilia bacterium]